MMTKIGYQGMAGSNSLEAALQMSRELSVDKLEYIPLITSNGVVEALLKDEVQYGVLAVRNVVAGAVKETEKALKSIKYEMVGHMQLSIHHCLFTKEAKNSQNEITQVASHIQALLQCKLYLKSTFPKAEQIEIQDTAIGAKYLAEGILNVRTAVICRKDAGERYGLHLLEENIEDYKGNYTEFIMIRKS